MERDLASRKEPCWTYDNDEFPETNKSIEWAESKHKHKFKIPEMPADDKLRNQPQYDDAGETPLDEDISTTSSSIFYAEGAHGYHNHYHHWGNSTANSTTNGTHAYDKSVTGRRFYHDWQNYHKYEPKHLDWWNRLEKDDEDGMKSIGLTWSDYNIDEPHNKKDYEKAANELVRKKEAKEAAEAGKKKLTKEDKEAAKEVAPLEKTEDTDDDKKDDGKKLSKEDSKKGSDAESKEESKDESKEDAKAKPETKKAAKTEDAGGSRGRKKFVPAELESKAQ